MYLHLYEPHVWFGKTFTSDALPDVTSPIYVSLGSTLGVHLLVTWVCNAWLYWFNLKRMMSCQLELESLLPLMQKKTPIYRWALRDTQTDYNVENMCVCVCVWFPQCLCIQKTNFVAAVSWSSSFPRVSCSPLGACVSSHTTVCVTAGTDYQIGIADCKAIVVICPCAQLPWGCKHRLAAVTNFTDHGEHVSQG